MPAWSGPLGALQPVVSDAVANQHSVLVTFDNSLASLLPEWVYKQVIDSFAAARPRMRQMLAAECCARVHLHVRVSCGAGRSARQRTVGVVIKARVDQFVEYPRTAKFVKRLARQMTEFVRAVL